MNATNSLACRTYWSLPSHGRHPTTTIANVPISTEFGNVTGCMSAQLKAAHPKHQSITWYYSFATSASLVSKVTLLTKNTTQNWLSVFYQSNRYLQKCIRSEASIVAATIHRKSIKIRSSGHLLKWNSSATINQLLIIGFILLFASLHNSTYPSSLYMYLVLYR